MDSQGVLPESRATAENAATIAAERAASSTNGDSIHSRSENNQQIQSEQQSAAFVPLCNSLLADSARANFSTGELATAAEFESAAAGTQTPFESWLESFEAWKATQPSHTLNGEDGSPTTARVANGSLDGTGSSKAATSGALLSSAVTTPPPVVRLAAGETGNLRETVADSFLSGTGNGGAHEENETKQCSGVCNTFRSGNLMCTKKVLRKESDVLHSIERGDCIQNHIEVSVDTPQEISASGAIEEAEADKTEGTRAQGGRARSRSLIRETKEQAGVPLNVERESNKGEEEGEEQAKNSFEGATAGAEPGKKDIKGTNSASEKWRPLAAEAIDEEENFQPRKDAEPGKKDIKGTNSASEKWRPLAAEAIDEDEDFQPRKDAAPGKNDIKGTNSTSEKWRPLAAEAIDEEEDSRPIKDAVASPKTNEREGKAFLALSRVEVLSCRATLNVKTDRLAITGSDEELLCEGIGSSHMMPVRNMAWHVTQFMKSIQNLMSYGCGVSGSSVPEKKGCGIDASRPSGAQITAAAWKNGTPTVVVDLSEAGKERPLLEDCVRGLGWRMARQQFTFGGITWLGSAISDEEHLRQAGHSLTVNRVPGLYEFARKRWLTRILSSMQQLDPEGFSFFPRTWLLPEDRAAVEKALQTPPVLGAFPTFGSRRSWTRTQSEVLPFSDSGKSFNSSNGCERLSAEGMQKQDNAGTAAMQQEGAVGDGAHASAATAVLPKNAEATEENDGERVPAAFLDATTTSMNENLSGLSKLSSLLPLLRGGRPSKNGSPSDGAAAAVAVSGGLAAAGEKLRRLGRKLRAIGTQIDAEFEKERDCYIFKPDNGAQGLGVRVVTAGKCIPEEIMAGRDGYIVQQYIKNPYLLRNKKFDFRIYVLILSVYPTMQVFLARRGLVRFCTVEYESPRPENLNNEYMHLTNYAINKEHTAYIRAAHVHDKANGKRLLEDVFEELQQDGVDVDDVWQQIVALVEKTMAVLAPFLTLRYKSTYSKLLGSYSRCFQIIGLDILLDDTCKAWLLEVNANPSLRADYDCNTITGISYTAESELDRRVKEPLLREALVLVYFCLVKPQLLLHEARRMRPGVVIGRVSERQRRRSKSEQDHDYVAPLPYVLAASPQLKSSGSRFCTQDATLKRDANTANSSVSRGALAANNAREQRDGKLAGQAERVLPSQVLLDSKEKRCSCPGPAAVSATAAKTVAGAAEAVAAVAEHVVHAVSANSSFDPPIACTLLKKGDETSAEPAPQQQQSIQAKNSVSLTRLHGGAHHQRAAETTARAHSPLRSSSRLCIRRGASCEEWKEPLADASCKPFSAKKDDDEHSPKLKPIALEPASPPVETGAAALQSESLTVGGAPRGDEIRARPVRFAGSTTRQSMPPQQRPSTDSTSATISDRLARNYSLPSITGVASPRKRLRPADDRLELAADKLTFKNVHFSPRGEMPAQKLQGLVPAVCVSHLLLPKQSISTSLQTPLPQTVTAAVLRGSSSELPQSAIEKAIPENAALEHAAIGEETLRGEANVRRRVMSREDEDAGLAAGNVEVLERKGVDAFTGDKLTETSANGFASRPFTREQGSSQGFAVNEDTNINCSTSEITKNPLISSKNKTVKMNTYVEKKTVHEMECEVVNQAEIAQKRTQKSYRQDNNQVDTIHIEHPPTKSESRVSKNYKVYGDDTVEENNAASSALLVKDVLRHCCIWNWVDMTWVCETSKSTDNTRSKKTNTCPAVLLYRCRLLFELVTNFPASKTLQLEQWMILCTRAKLEKHIEQLWVANPVPYDETSQVADRAGGVLKKSTRTCRRFAQRPLGKRDLVLLYMRQLKKSINQQPAAKTGLRGLCFWNFWELVCTLSSLTHVLLMRPGDDCECQPVDGHFAAREQQEFTTGSASRQTDFDSKSRAFLHAPHSKYFAFSEVGNCTGNGRSTAQESNLSNVDVSVLHSSESHPSGQHGLNSTQLHGFLEKKSSCTRLDEQLLQVEGASQMSCNDYNKYTAVEQSGSSCPAETESRCGGAQKTSAMTQFKTDLKQCRNQLDISRAAAAEGRFAAEKRDNAGRLGACLIQGNTCNAQTRGHTDTSIKYSDNGASEPLTIAGFAGRRHNAATTRAEVVCRSGTRIYIFSWPDVQKISDMMSDFQRARAIDYLLRFLRSSYLQRKV